MAMVPAGTVTFLFSDIEGSTRLLQRLGDIYGDLVARHRQIIRDATADAGGIEIDTQGDGFFLSFGRARDAVAAAVTAQRRLGAEEWPHRVEVKVRMGIHTGEPTLGEEGYLGLDVVRGARIAAVAHGGQIVVSETTRALLPRDLPDGAELVDLGEHSLKDLEHPERLFGLVAPGLPAEFPAPRTEREPADELAGRINAFVMRTVTSALEESDARKRESQRSLFRRRKRSR